MKQPEGIRTETRDGKEYRVVSLPEQKPPKGRSKKTRFKMKDVGKEGNRGS